MRYPDGGGLTDADRAHREQVRLQAAAMFSEGLSPPQVAVRLRVSRKSAHAWQQAWCAGGVAKLLHRLGYSAQRPAHRAVERDEAAVTTWRRDRWPQVKEQPRPAAPGSASSTRPASR